MIEIKKLELPDREMVTDFFRRYPPDISEFTFTNLFIWQDARPVFYSLIDDSLVFYINNRNCPGDRKVIFGSPVGDVPLNYILKLMGDQITGAARVNKKKIDEFKKVGMFLESDRDNYDYIYRVTDLAALSGRKYSKKRNHIKRCHELYDCKYEKITSENITEIDEMMERWCKSRNCCDDPDLIKEYHAVKNVFKHFEELKLTGGAIRIDGKIQAFAVAEALKPGTAVWHFEKAMREYHGLNQLITHWFAQYNLQKFEFVNREQDLGLPGLRQAKMSYYPVELLVKYNAIRKGYPSIPKSLIHFCEDYE